LHDNDSAGPLARYRAQIEQGQLLPDPGQQALAEILDQRYRALLTTRTRSWLPWRRKRRSIRGIYLYGRVGRGKTLLMDLLATSLDAAGVPVLRTHFHRFMDAIHDDLARFKGKRQPLTRVAGQIAGRARVLCLDEFHVNDIGDAMILGELLKQLAELDVVLFTTSNTAPSKLYADGLQRARFLPAIELIKARCEVVNLDAEEDYRLRELTRHPVYYWPESSDTLSAMEDEFRALAALETQAGGTLIVSGREMPVIKRAGSLAWFSFQTLCCGPRAAADYIDLAKRFSTLMISGIPQLDDGLNDETRRFIHLIDECYDRSVKLVISAAEPPDGLYTGKRLRGPFERTASRLIEMQSRDYLGRAHQP
jgi:cell division protein ZapE